MATPVTSCRICGSRDLADVLSLGDMPPVNSFLKDQADIAREGRHPLALAYCAACTHVQLTHMLDPKDVFTDYIYFSSMSETVVRHGEALAARYAKEISLAKGDLVAELASNDGCILKPFRAHARVYGVEPAKNIAEVANKEGVPTLADFFHSKTAEKVRKEQGGARLIMARNVVAHVPDLVDFVRGVAHWLTDDGIFHVEVPYLREMTTHLEFDTIYHEHLSYFSVTALDRLFKEAGLVFWDVEELGLHGGSLIARGMKAGTTPKPSVARYIEEERASGYVPSGKGVPAPLQKFADGTRRLKTAIPELLRKLKAEGKSLAGYGAAAKGVVLLNYCGIGKDVLSFVADKSPYKQNMLMPGVHIPVVHPNEVMAKKPDVIVVLAWNFFEEIRRQLEAFEKGGGRFVLPVPEPRLV
jgi:novobiocin biosynthesis protein NovU/D-mycarose 3-C-methyltransferase